MKAERQSPALVVYLSALLVVPCGKVPGHAARRHHLAGRKESATVHRLRHGRARQLTRPFEPAAGNRLALAGLLKARMRSDLACRVQRGLRLSQPGGGGALMPNANDSAGLSTASPASHRDGRARPRSASHEKVAPVLFYCPSARRHGDSLLAAEQQPRAARANSRRPGGQPPAAAQASL